MSVVIPPDQIVPVNSTSYIDMLGVSAGLERLPDEDAAGFAERIDLAVSASRGAEYAGLMNSLALELGLSMRQAIHISADADFDADVTFGQLRLAKGGVSVDLPLLSLTSDDFWQWRSLSEVASAVAALPGYTAVFEGADGPALQLVRQSNRQLVVGEELSGGRSAVLAHGPVVAGSEVFSQAVGSYTIAGRTLQFAAQPPAGTAVSYRYRVCPYGLIASPAAVLSLADPQVREKATGTNGAVIHQAREYLQEILRRDGSYWGR